MKTGNSALGNVMMRYRVGFQAITVGLLAHAGGFFSGDHNRAVQKKFDQSFRGIPKNIDRDIVDELDYGSTSS